MTADKMKPIIDIFMDIPDTYYLIGYFAMDKHFNMDKYLKKLAKALLKSGYAIRGGK